MLKNETVYHFRGFEIITNSSFNYEIMNYEKSALLSVFSIQSSEFLLVPYLQLICSECS